jgi:hypothetical protein
VSRSEVVRCLGVPGRVVERTRADDELGYAVVEFAGIRWWQVAMQVLAASPQDLIAGRVLEVGRAMQPRYGMGATTGRRSVVGVTKPAPTHPNPMSLSPKSNTMIEILNGLPAHTVGFKMSGKLHDADYKKFVPLVDAEIAKEGKVNVLAQFHDFHGWDAKALWDDTKFSTTHCTKFKKIALIGEKTWERWMAKVCKPFTMAKLRYFDVSEIDAAKAWLAEA